MSQRERRDLERAATELLHRAGATWSGRSQNSVNKAQVAFERRFISTPTGGKPRS